MVFICKDIGFRDGETTGLSYGDLVDGSTRLKRRDGRSYGCSAVTYGGQHQEENGFGDLEPRASGSHSRGPSVTRLAKNMRYSKDNATTENNDDQGQTLQGAMASTRSYRCFSSGSAYLRHSQ